MVAEIIKYYWPKLIDLHNYAPASSLLNKISNWETLNRKVNFNDFHIGRQFYIFYNKMYTIL